MSGIKVAGYPDFSEVTLDMRPALHGVMRDKACGVSEYTFANIYLFRQTHSYRLSDLGGGLFVVSGNDDGADFFMLPAGMPGPDLLGDLFERFSSMKCASRQQAAELESMGYAAVEDRDNFDYLYLREDMARLSGRKFHKKKNLVNYFTGSYNYEGRPLLVEYMADAEAVLEQWRAVHGENNDYAAAKEGLMLAEEIQLCGGIYYVEGRPAAYTLGEELTDDTFVIHFEKGIEGYKGLLQFVNQSFAEILPEKYVYINREQDLGDEGLRHAKESYKPAGFVKKFRVSAPSR